MYLNVVCRCVDQSEPVQMFMFKVVEPKSMNCWRWGGAGSAKPYDVYARAPYETNLDVLILFV